MSYILAAAALQIPDLKPLDKFLLIALCDFADEDGGNCFPSVRKLCEITGLSRATLYRCLSNLEDAALVERDQQYVESGRQTANSYRIIMEIRVFDGKKRVIFRTGGVSHRDTPQGGTVSEVDGGRSQDDTPSGSQIEMPTYPTNIEPAKKDPTNGEAGCQKFHPQPDEYSPGFLRFYEAYPKKKQKAAAYRAWRKLNPSDELVDEIVAHVEARKVSDRDWLKQSGQYIPYPATFINGEGWTDEYQLDYGCGENGNAAVDVINNWLNRETA